MVILHQQRFSCLLTAKPARASPLDEGPRIGAYRYCADRPEGSDLQVVGRDNDVVRGYGEDLWSRLCRGQRAAHVRKPYFGFPLLAP
jgi:hypothetical protein